MCINNNFADKIMKITENVNFAQEIDSQDAKLIYEYRALAIIKLIFGKRADGFVKLESPDLQNSKTNVGIEVVRSHPENYFKVDKLEKKYVDNLKNGNITEQQKVKKKIEEEGFEMLGNKSVFYKAHSTIENNTFYNAILSKSQKIDEYKANGFGKIGLFVWHLSPVVTDFVEDIPNEWSQLLKDGACHLKREFDFIIVVVEHTVLFFNKDYDCEQSIEIPLYLFRRLSVFGRMAAEGIITDNDPIWN